MEIINFNDTKAKELLIDNQVIALPTETVYGLGIRFDSQLAYDRLCKAKKRNPDKAIAIMCSLHFDFDKYFEISLKAKKVMNYFLPGPLTCLVKARENTPYQCHLGTFIAGIRVPEKEELLSFLSSLEFPLQVTSANISGQSSIKEFDDVYNVFKDNPYVKAIIKGKCESGTPTTVVDLSKNEPILIRQGDITIDEILKIYNS